MPMTYGEERAINEIKSVLDSQWKNGMIPHIRFVSGEKGYSPDYNEWGLRKSVTGIENKTSGITQPPVLAYAMYKIYLKSKNKKEVLKNLEKFYSGVKKYHDFLLRERDPFDEYLVSIIHPWETGTDNTPYQDKPIEKTKMYLRVKRFEQRIKKRKDIEIICKKYRPTDKDYECFGRLIGFFVEHNYNQEKIIKNSPYVVQDVFFNSIFAASLDSLSKLCMIFSNNIEGKKSDFYRKESEKNKELYEKVRHSIRKKLFNQNDGVFYSYDTVDRCFLKSPTVHCIAPLFGRCATKKQAKKLISLCFSKKDFNPDIMVSTTSKKSKQFNNLKYWRGPVWPAPINWLIYEGMKNYDKFKAEKLRKNTLKIVEYNKKFPIIFCKKLASSLMEFNSFGEEFTTPSKAQYHHGWFWDSCFAAVGWVNVDEKPRETDIWDKVNVRISEIKNKRGLEKINSFLGKEFDIFLFDEYFVSSDGRGYSAGEPIGSPMMTWSAALYLDLKKMDKE